MRLLATVLDTDYAFAGVETFWYAALALLVFVPPAAHLKWKHRGYWLGDDHVVTRNGVWNRETKIVPYYRVQTVIDSRTVFQRRWRVATVTVDTAGSLSILGRDAAAVDIEQTDAGDLRDDLTERLRVAVAQRRATIVRWLQDLEKLRKDSASLEMLGMFRGNAHALPGEGSGHRHPSIGESYKSLAGVSEVVDFDLKAVA